MRHTRTRSEAAQLLGVNERTIPKFLEAGTLTSTGYGHSHITVASIENLLGAKIPEAA